MASLTGTVTVTSLATGFAGGFVATVVMTVVQLLVAPRASPPPTADFWAKYVGGGYPADYELQGLALHLLYGTVVGALFVPAFAVASGVFTPELADVYGIPAGRVAGGLLWGFAYGFVLFVVGLVFWIQVVVGRDALTRMRANLDLGLPLVFLAVHLVYGLTLGLVVALV